MLAKQLNKLTITISLAQNEKVTQKKSAQYIDIPNGFPTANKCSELMTIVKINTKYGVHGIP